MSGARDTLERVIGALESAGARYMVVGSFASTLHGQPRTTQDIDLVIDASPSELDRFLESLPESEWYYDVDAAHEALRRRSMFNLVDLRTGWKAGLICLRDGAFAAEEFARRMPADLLGLRVRVTTTEDTVLAKLIWARESGTERQREDAAGIVAAAGNELDRAYLDRWASELEVVDLWRAIEGEADA